MKKIILGFFISISLVGCDQISSKAIEKIEKMMPEASELQQKKSDEIFKALVAKNDDQLFALLEPKVVEDLKADPETLKIIYQITPDQLGVEPLQINLTKAIEVGTGKYTKLVKQYDYPDQTIIVSTVFAGHDGGDKVIGLWVQQPNVITE